MEFGKWNLESGKWNYCKSGIWKVESGIVRVLNKNQTHKQQTLFAGLKQLLTENSLLYNIVRTLNACNKYTILICTSALLPAGARLMRIVISSCIVYKSTLSEVQAKKLPALQLRYNWEYCLLLPMTTPQDIRRAYPTSYRDTSTTCLI